MSKWKVNIASLLIGLIWRTLKYLALPFYLKTLIFDAYLPLEWPNLYYALNITWYVFNILTFLAHPPTYQTVKVKEEDHH